MEPGFAVLAVFAGIGVVLAISGILVKLRFKAAMSRETITSGTLLAFRWLASDAPPGVSSANPYKEIYENKPVSWPIMQFQDGAHTVRTHANRPNKWLCKDDIGKNFPLRYKKSVLGGKTVYRFHLADERSQRERAAARALGFWVLIGLGLMFIGMGAAFYALI